MTMPVMNGRQEPSNKAVNRSEVRRGSPAGTTNRSHRAHYRHWTGGFIHKPYTAAALANQLSDIINRAQFRKS